MELKKFYTETTAKQPEYMFATIAEVDLSKGVRLLFDGAREATQKFYVCSDGLSVSEGDRVKICKDSGTYVVEYKIGLPGAARDEFKFKINGAEFTALASMTWSEWISSAYNSEGYDTLYETPLYFIVDENNNKIATIPSRTAAITANKNYVLGKGDFKINGTQYEAYSDPTSGLLQTGQSWIRSDLNSSGLFLTLGTPSGYTYGYYFTTNNTISTAIAKFGPSSAERITEGHNYTMNG